MQMRVVLIYVCVQDSRLCTYLAWAKCNEIDWGFRGSALIKVSIPIRKPWSIVNKRGDETQMLKAARTQGDVAFGKESDIISK